jgi:hypothetical protein
MVEHLRTENLEWMERTGEPERVSEFQYRKAEDEIYAAMLKTARACAALSAQQTRP